MRVLNALQIKAGAKVEKSRVGTLTQPIQFLSKEEKNDEWKHNNMDWFELQGLKQLKRNAKRLLKNYKLAKGIIDRSDYIVEEDNEMRDLIEVLTKEDESALELKFYPIIPNVINVLTSEFAKRSTTINFRAVDEYSYNDMMEQKKSMVEENLLAQAAQKMQAKLLEMGMDPDDEQFQEQLSPENIKSLPEIEGFFKKSYRGIPEQWATHQKIVDEERFSMHELEERGFKDMLITDREFWHFKMGEDDYDVELWNPVLTFYHKSPDVRYISQGNYVGKVDMLSIADAIDKYGWLMTEDQLKSLEDIYPATSALYDVGGYQNDGSFYDASKSHSWNTEGASLGMRQYLSYTGNFVKNGSDIVQWILGESEDFLDHGSNGLLRATTIYWKTQRRVGHLTKIGDDSETIIDIVDESYKITTKPLYDNSLFTDKSKRNLIYGEHIDWIWINEVYGGVKIGQNHPGSIGSNNDNFSPIYVGINQNKIGRLKFQFKGDHTLYGCKLPVEGAVFSDRNTKSTALVDLMKPFQIGYNMVNNQIADILVDELGTVIMLDQNALPRHSMGEDWGKGNFSKAYVAMKNFQMLPLDTGISNTENALNFNHFQVLNMEQTNRLKSRVELATYFKNEAFATIGLNPQRMGQQIGKQTATGVEESLNASYAQTEIYFMQHCDYLMPRVHQMRTDLAQYYQSNKPSLRLQYMTSADEKMNFSMNGTDLLLRDLNVFCTTKANHRAMLEQLKQLMVTNNTTGATIYDIGKVMQTESIAELNTTLKAVDEKQAKIRSEESQSTMATQQQMIDAKTQERKEQQEFEAAENEKDRQAGIYEAKIKASGYGAMEDINGNQQSDFLDYMDTMNKDNQFNQTMGFNKQKENNKTNSDREKLNIEREKLGVMRENKEKDLQIARENKTKSELQANKKIPKK